MPPEESAIASAPAPGRCAEHGGLMWSNAMRACITHVDVIRGGCRWEPLSPEGIGLERIEGYADVVEFEGPLYGQADRG